MADQDAEQSAAPFPALPPTTPAEPPAGRSGRGPGRGFGGRPLSVYLVLAAGLAVLVVLLALVVLTGRDDAGPQPPICLPLTPEEAERGVNGGLVAQVNVLTEEGRPETGPLAVTFDLADGNCRELPKGVRAQPDFYRLIGLVTVYNQTRAGEQRIVLSWRQQGDIPADLLGTPPPATATATAEATATGTPATAASPTPMAAPTSTPVPTAAAAASPVLPPATPRPAPTATATATASAVPTRRPGSPAATPTPARDRTRVPPPLRGTATQTAASPSP